MNLAPVLSVLRCPSGVMKSACTVWSVAPWRPSVLRLVRSSPPAASVRKVFSMTVVPGVAANWYESTKLRLGLSAQRCW